MSASMVTDRFCAELYDYIIDFLHDDLPALRVCALVCRSWVPASRSHLFHHLILTGCPSATSSWAPNTSCRRIFATIRASPYIASYVNKLSIQESAVSRPSTYRWVSEEIAFPSLLKKLASLKELEFNFPAPGPSDAKTVWSTMVFKDVSDTMSTLTLDSLAIRQFSFSTLADFVKILDSCCHLKKLQFDSVDISTATHLSASALEHVLSLQPSNTLAQTSERKADLNHLLMRSNSSPLFIPILLHPRSPVDLSALRSLVINITSDNYLNVLELLRCTPNLISLELEIDPFFDYEARLDRKDVIDLLLTPSLKSLTLQVSVLLARIDPLPWLLAFFSTVRPDNCLECISLTCVIDKPPPSLTIQTFEDSLAGWRELDDLLTQSTFATLRRFRLDFALDNPIGDETLAQVSDEFIKELQNLSKKGVLEVDVCEVR